MKLSFDFVYFSLDNRPYHFQAEDEGKNENLFGCFNFNNYFAIIADQKIWLSVLINCKEKALAKAFQHANPQMSPSLIELQKTVIK